MERRRLADVLHDGPVQALSAAALLVEAALGRLEAAGADPDAVALLARAREALERAGTQTREVMRELDGDP